MSFSENRNLSSEAQQILLDLARQRSYLFVQVFMTMINAIKAMQRYTDHFASITRLNFAEVERRASELREIDREEYLKRQAAEGKSPPDQTPLLYSPEIIAAHIDMELIKKLGLTYHADVPSNPYTYEPQLAEDVFVFMLTVLREEGDLLHIWNSYDRVLETLQDNNEFNPDLVILFAELEHLMEGVSDAGGILNEFNTLVGDLQRELMKFNQASGISQDWFEELTKSVDLSGLPGEDTET